MAGRFLNLFKVFRTKKKKGPEAGPAQQPEEPEQFQTRQDDASLDGTQVQKPGHSRFRRTLKMFRKFLRVQRRETGTSAAEGPAKPDSGLTELQAEPDVSLDSAELSQVLDTTMNENRVNRDEALAQVVAITNANTRETEAIANSHITPTVTLSQELTPDYFKDPCASSQEHVPAIVRNIHQRLLSHDTVDVRLQIDIVRLAEEHPVDVVLTLLRCAPTCDRTAEMMWKTIGSVGPAVEKVLPTLLCVMEDWPVHSASTSKGDDTDVFALAATLVIWVIVQVPECQEAMILHSSRLFVALLFHIVITTQQMPPAEAGHFWKACRKEHRLTINPSRFAVQTMKALLYRLQCDKEVMAMERKRGWDTLLCAHTQHYAVGLLAREMRRNLVPFCSHIAFHLLQPLSSEKPRWDLPFLAFLVEVLNFLDFSKHGDSTLKIMSSSLQSKCREQRRLALRGLMVLSKDPLMARSICSLSKNLVELLDDADGDVVSMTLHVFTNVLQHKDILISSTTAPKLAEALLRLFDHDNSFVRVRSLELFRVMDLVVDEGKKPLEKILRQSLLPLFFHCHDENWDVAEASRETLLGVAECLKRRKLKQIVKNNEQLPKFAEVLLAEDTSRVAEHLRRVLPYLKSPQKHLREAAIRFMDIVGFPSRKGQQAEFQVLYKGLESPKNNANPSCSNTDIHAKSALRAEEIGSFSASSEPVSQEQHQETLNRTPSPTATGPLSIVDDWYS